MYKYPYGDSQQLNLDWIISKIKELEAGGSGGAADLEAVANALVTLSFNLNTQYRRYDYCFLNGKLYRCLSDTSGVFDPSAWQEALIGDDLAVLTRWINAIDAAAVVDVKFDTTGTNGKIQQKYHDQYHDVVEVDYAPVQNSKRPLSSNAGYELNSALNNTVHIAPDYTGATDINSIAQAAIARMQANNYALQNKLFTFTANYQTGEPTGYFGTASVTVLCKYSSSNYGYGLLLSDNGKNIAAFRTSIGTTTLLPIGDIKFYAIENKTGSVTLAGSARTTVTIPAGKTGYHLLGIINIYIPDTEVMAIHQFYTSGTDAMVTLENTYTAERTSAVRVTVLYESD